MSPEILQILTYIGTFFSGAGGYKLLDYVLSFRKNQKHKQLTNEELELKNESQKLINKKQKEEEEISARQKEIAKLDAEILQKKKLLLESGDDLDENDIKVLKALSKSSSYNVHELVMILNLHQTQVHFSVEHLREMRLVESSRPVIGRPANYGLTQTGRKYALDNKFLEQE